MEPVLTLEANTVLKARYLKDNETAGELFRRVACHVARAESFYGCSSEAAGQEYYRLMAGLEFLPNSPTLFNAGKTNGQLAACFVLPIGDSLAGIFETLKNTALIHQSGGGTGFSFSRLRPAGDTVNSTGGVASGPVSFMEIYDAATQIVKQGAARRGANMAILRIDHPDIRQFITVKRKRDILNNFNLSVGITDQFMQAVKKGDDYSLVNPRDNTIAERVAARELFDLLAEMAWENGEPGLFFLDAVNRANPTPALGEFEAPNPCSEQPLLPYESCVLGSINLTKMLLPVDGEKVVFDYEKLRRTVRLAVRFLDNVIDVNNYPLPEVERATGLTRKIGLGIMGLSDLFIRFNIPYASQQAVDMTASIMHFITEEARRISSELGEARGSFPEFANSIYPKLGFKTLRNATVTTIAPTGSISIIAGCSSGIEPLFGLAMTRRVLDGRLIASVNQVVVDYLIKGNLWSDEVEAAIMGTGSVAGLNLPLPVKQTLATAHEISAEWHVAQLAAAQCHTDNGVSKTVNLPHNATREDVANVFWRAFINGCKGVTVYRDGSRDQQVLTQGAEACEECGSQ
ncbi:MAG TPA: adenosylcobalamin-dependent ribonucleoside-diphosphate reductase [Methylomusa anaerophila]|uniref:Vitamin B12-dependent ribonucleotide reductase n=1 Tax=Methylomusa anaerophila TaxID=1930071 RepID=A0A348ANP5_9FIRM|nr:adenosylcobalamin-dependent ribonucleoside-diphosphate reductase [Methylomusa anaerophila]BBB92693.1 ribonucleoside-diphosphate reductase NrdZ [Methylomusa anaerophila]HML87454.1 adenosylcobalamin-dependent ribonucleoside-diphosphate reductase [Methylomusa anaerophila]